MPWTVALVPGGAMTAAYAEIGNEFRKLHIFAVDMVWGLISCDVHQSFVFYTKF